MRILYEIRGIRKISLYLQNIMFNSYYKKILSSNVKIFGFPIISIKNPSQLKIGKNLILISNSYFSEAAINHPVILRALNDSARIEIGNNVGISGGGICAAKEIEIGHDVLIGANAFVTDTDFHTINPDKRRYTKDDVKAEKVIIKENVFIGMNSIILKGVTIGKNTIIGAGSIVTKNISENVIAAGNPCRVLRELEKK